MPSNLDFLQGSTLVCAGLTAWNGLYGLESRGLKPGDWVLTQGTGGVSMFAVQFAKAAGAKVIATTSSAAKGEKLKALGADHVINYKEVENWGEEAKKLTPGGRGVQHILEVGGPNTMVRFLFPFCKSASNVSLTIIFQTQSLKAISFDGVISIVGFLGGVKGEQQPTFLDCLVSPPNHHPALHPTLLIHDHITNSPHQNNICTVRGVLVGSRLQFEEMNRAIEANDIKPIVDEKVFTLDEAKDAYQYMWDQKHFGKLCIKIE